MRKYFDMYSVIGLNQKYFIQLMNTINCNTSNLFITAVQYLGILTVFISIHIIAVLVGLWFVAYLYILLWYIDYLNLAF